MGEQSVAREIARVEAPAHLIEVSLSEFAKLLPPTIKPEAFGRWALTVLRQGLNSPEQGEAWARVLNPNNPAGIASVMVELQNAATLGLEPGREFHLVPFGGTVAGITDYKGEIRLITNARRCSVVAQLVRKEDEFYLTGANVPPRHDADWFTDRGPVTGGYAYADYGEGEFSLVVRMSEADFEQHKGKAKTKRVWDEWPEPMRLKTLIHTLRKWTNWSATREW